MNTLVHPVTSTPTCASAPPPRPLAWESALLPDLLLRSAERTPQAVALVCDGQVLSYSALQTQVQQCTNALLGLGIARGERVGIYLEKCMQAVVASFAAAAAGAVLVPINPVLKPEQVGFILRDCDVRLLVTSAHRHALLAPLLAPPHPAHGVRHVLLSHAPEDTIATQGVSPVPTTHWDSLASFAPRCGHRVIDTDMAAIFYTSGSTGGPKGVVLSHRNLVLGAKSVASYLGNHAQDRLLAALPLSFDAGFSQLTTAFHVGARAVLLTPLLARDVLCTMETQAITGLTAVPALFIQLARLDWPAGIDQSLRYFANTGGRMPLHTLNALRQRVPSASPFLMYGLTEAFRSTCLMPGEVAQRPDSIGRAIPHAEILVLREDGTPCGVDEPGELVHRGALVAMGYWNDPVRTAERFRVLPAAAGVRQAGQPLPEYAVFSGDTVRQDAEGFLYFVGRRDELIKTSGYRVSPTEVEEVLYASALVDECIAFGVDHAELGQAIQVIATPATGSAAGSAELLLRCRQHMPAYMVPGAVTWLQGPLPRNPNGKIDRVRLVQNWRRQHAS